jgi:hypothetical protein
MPSDPLPEPPSNQNVRDAEWFDKGWKAAMRRIAEGEQEARTLARAEVIAELRAAVEGLEKETAYAVAQYAYQRVLAALSRLGERE